MAAAFLLGGQRGAHARQHPEWSPAEWLNDPTCYGAAEAAVKDALDAFPDPAGVIRAPPQADLSLSTEAPTVKIHEAPEHRAQEQLVPPQSTEEAELQKARAVHEWTDRNIGRGVVEEEHDDE